MKPKDSDCKYHFLKLNNYIINKCNVNAAATCEPDVGGHVPPPPCTALAQGVKPDTKKIYYFGKNLLAFSY